MTTAEYLQTPETMLPRELVFGQLRVADAPRVSHQRMVGKLYLALAPFVQARRLGELLLAPTDVILDDAAALVVQPDLMVVSPDRASSVTDLVQGAPDLIIDVLSPDPRIGALQERVGWFARYGARECWLVSLPERSVVLLTFDANVIKDRRKYRAGEVVESAVVPGFTIPADLFPGYG